MKIRVKPIFGGEETYTAGEEVNIYERNSKLFVIQQEKQIFGLRYWRDVRDIHGYPVICTPEEVQSYLTHLSRVQEI